MRSPVTPAQRGMLQQRVADVAGEAKRRGIALDEYDKRRQQWVAETDFELGCWLWWASQREGTLSVSQRAQIACAVFATGRASVGHDFLTVFEFGERDWNRGFASVDAAEVQCEVVRQVRASGDPLMYDALQRSRWNHPTSATPPTRMAPAAGGQPRPTGLPKLAEPRPVQPTPTGRA